MSDRGAGAVAAQVVTSDGREQKLHRLPGGRFAGIPVLEGIVEVRCRDGSIDAADYVTPGRHTRVVVERGPPGRACQARDE